MTRLLLLLLLPLCAVGQPAQHWAVAMLAGQQASGPPPDTNHVHFGAMRVELYSDYKVQWTNGLPGDDVAATNGQVVGVWKNYFGETNADAINWWFNHTDMASVNETYFTNSGTGPNSQPYIHFIDDFRCLLWDKASAIPTGTQVALAPPYATFLVVRQFAQAGPDICWPALFSSSTYQYNYIGDVSGNNINFANFDTGVTTTFPIWNGKWFLITTLMDANDSVVRTNGTQAFSNYNATANSAFNGYYFTGACEPGVNADYACFIALTNNIGASNILYIENFLTTKYGPFPQ